jgi:hypothetical protein
LKRNTDYQAHPHAGFIEGVELGRWNFPCVGAWPADDRLVALRPGRIPGIVLNAHLLLSILTVANLAAISVLALRKSLIGNPFASASATRPA